MISDLIRLLVYFLDWRGFLRMLRGEPCLDVVFISNIRSLVDRKRLMGLFNSGASHFGLVRLYLNNIIGHIRIINSTYEEILSPDGFRKAKKQTLEAVKWASKKGAKVVLFASSTKRLFGNDGSELKKMFPDILFSIGDNGTAMMLQKEIEIVTKKIKLDLSESRAVVLGANGFIGKVMVQYLKKQGVNVVGMGTSLKRLKKLQSEYEVDITDNINKVGEVDFVVACTHINGAKLTSSNIDFLRKKNKKLLVFDMAQPPNLDFEEYNLVANKVIRLDSADAYSKKLHYVLGYIGYHSTGVPRGVTFGCFSEAIVLASLMKQSKQLEKEIKTIDYYNICSENIIMIEKFYKKSKTEFVPQKEVTYSKPIIIHSSSLDL